MFDKDIWIEIFQSIKKNKLRSILSGFTISFAILLFTLLFGMGNGLQNTFKKEFAKDAINSIYFYSGVTTKPYKGKKTGRRVEFTNDDNDAIKEQFLDKIQVLSPRIQRQMSVVNKDEQGSYTVRGVYPGYEIIESAEASQGRFLNIRDIKSKAKSVVIGRMVEKDLFGELSALGKNLNINGIIFKVIGVFTDPGGDQDERYIYAPFSTIQTLYGYQNKFDDFAITYDPKMSVDNAIKFGVKMQRFLKERHSISPNDQSGIRIRNMADGNQKVSQMMNGLNILIIVIGLGTLIAGVVGISNIMVYVVKERTKEIGIRKAIGASPKAIISMIILESVFITTIAGYFGLLLGFSILKYASPSLEKFFIINPGVSTSLVIAATFILILSGLIAGFLPAKKAANIKPIVALQSD